MKRRNFIKKMSIGAGSAASLHLCDMIDANYANAFSTSTGMGIEAGLYFLDKGKEKNTMPQVRREIRDNPRAVFLMRTHVDARKDSSGHYTEASPQLESAGNEVARQLFVKGDIKGGSTFIKPNFTFAPEHCHNRTTGVYSSPDFIVGMAEHLRNIGNTNLICGEGPTNAQNHRSGGIYGAFDPAGILMIEAGYERFSHFKKDELNWHKVENSPIWKRIPSIRPVGDKDNFLINISSMKCHLTGLTTLAVKNLQGIAPKGYGQFCTSWDALEPGARNAGINFKRDFHKDFYQRIEAEFVKHMKAGFKRWDRHGSYRKYVEKGGWDAFRKVKDNDADRNEFMKGIGALMRHEMWMHRGLENAVALKPQLNIVEGIISLDGEELNRDKIGEDQLTNMIIAGISPFEVDAVGSYIMGHDPKEIWYTRVAKERGFGECDVNKIDVYWIENGEIRPIKNISEIPRYRIGLNWARKANPEERLFW